MRKPFNKNLKSVPLEDAHGGSGKRQLILSDLDDISKNLEAMTKGFLNPGFSYDWHSHEDIDEFFYVISGEGVIYFSDGTECKYKSGEIFYTPANLEHKITATSTEPSEYFFIRIRN